jgi:outer membrane immunogenic protein
MHRLMVAIAAAGLSSSAFAADLYTKAPAPSKSWTGFYTGVDLGYGWKDPTVSISGADPLMTAIWGGLFGGTAPSQTISFENKGVFGGLVTGYNWQVNRNWLVGVEADFNASNIHGQGTSSSLFQSTNPTITQIITANQNIQWFGTVRPRLGWLATDDLLLYGTGGFAFGRVDEQVGYGLANFTGANVVSGFGFGFACTIPSRDCFIGSSTRTATGWTAGGGAEYRVPGSNASIKAEYLYVNLGQGDDFRVVARDLGCCVPGRLASFNAAYSQTTDFHTVKLGINWHW